MKKNNKFNKCLAYKWSQIIFEWNKPINSNIEEIKDFTYILFDKNGKLK